MQSATDKTITVQLFKSPAGSLKKHISCVRGLGLKKTGSQSTVIDTPANRGMINKVSYMVRIINQS